MAYEVGMILGANNALLILDKFKNDKGRIMYVVECQICKQDRELHKDATYNVASDYFSSGKLPCGCSKSKKWAKWQWEVLMERKAKSNNHEFLGFVEDTEKVGENSHIKLKCHNCGNYWETGNLGNYSQDRGCPSCADKLRAYSKLTSSEEWVCRFRATGFFPEDIYTFERKTETSRLWKVKCKRCGDFEFTADRSNLVAGKVPCNCGTGGGYDISKTGYFYVLEIDLNGDKFIKFGISNFPRRRIVGHKRILREYGGIVTASRIFSGDGKEVLAIESKLKRDLPILNKMMDGFRKETCSADKHGEVLGAVKHLCEVLDDISI